MRKDLKGKELGVGISQRKDKVYQARYFDRWGKRKSIYNSNLRELRKKLAEAVSKNENFFSIKEEITLDKWFDRWMEVYKEKAYDLIQKGNILIFTIKTYLPILAEDVSIRW